MKQTTALTVAIALLTIMAFFVGTKYTSMSTKQPTSHKSAFDSYTGPIADQSQPPIALRPTVPFGSGHSYHAIDLLKNRPFPDQGRLVALDVISQPNVDDDGRILGYPRPYLGHIPSEANARGVRYKQMLSADTCMYDIVIAISGEGRIIPGSPGVSADGRTIPDVAGQISVEVPKNAGCPREESVWDVEPIGTEEVTLGDGTVRQLPKIRFWRYHGER